MAAKMLAHMFLVLLVSVKSVTSSRIIFEATPTTIQHLVTDQLLMRCSLQDLTTTTRSGDDKLAHTNNPDVPNDNDVTSRAVTATDINYVSSIVVLRNNKDVASISTFAPAKSLDNSTSLQVRGQVVANGSELGYLEVSWTNPGPDQSGSYSCEVHGFDEVGHPKTVEETIEVNETEVTIRDLAKYIHDIKLTNQNLSLTVQDLKNEDKLKAAIIGNMSDTIQNLTSSIQDLNVKSKTNDANVANMNNIINTNTNNINTCNNNIADVKSNITQINHNINTNTKNINTCNNNVATIKDQITQINNDINIFTTNLTTLTTKMNTTVIFTAGLSSDVLVKYPNTVVFDKVLLNVGGGYDRTTGKFTCPVAGIYLFHVHVRGQSGKYVAVYIVHNIYHISYILADGGYGYQSASSSVSVRLNLGDTVYVKSNGASYLKGYSINPACTFTGQLISEM